MNYFFSQRPGRAEAKPLEPLEKLQAFYELAKVSGGGATNNTGTGLAWPG